MAKILILDIETTGFLQQGGKIVEAEIVFELYKIGIFKID